MSNKFFQLMILIILAAFSAASAVSAQDDLRVSNVFYQSDLRQALEDVAAQAKVNIIVDPGVQGVVSVTLENATVEKAITLLLAGTGYQMQVMPDYYLVFSPDETAGMFPSVAKTHMVSVQHVSPETARSLLPNPLQRYVRVDGQSGKLAVTAPTVLLDRILLDLDTIDRPTVDKTVFVALNHVKAATTRDMLPEPLQRFVRVDADRNTLAITAPSESRKQILDHVAELDVVLPATSYDAPNLHPTHVVKLNYAKATSAMNLLPAALGNYVRADEESNTLAISAPRHMLKTILADVSAIDVPRKHVMLDARVVVLSRADLLDFGGEWRLPEISAGTVLGAAVGIPWELRIGYTAGREFTNALSLTLNLLTQNEEATIIASPKVMAQDGKEAEIKVATEEYFQITSDIGTFLRADLEKIETGTILGITPQVGPNGELTLNMRIEVSDVVARGEKNLPVVSRRIAHSTVQIESGGTAAIAGLVDTRSQVGKSGIPGAANLPLLGHMFRTDKLSHQARQVAVFVTATVVGEGDRQFSTGRKRKPPTAYVNDNLFRADLEAALDRLGAQR